MPLVQGHDVSSLGSSWVLGVGPEDQPQPCAAQSRGEEQRRKWEVVSTVASMAWEAPGGSLSAAA